MKILSLFDGMACGHIAFTNLGIPVDEYHAYEIDKYAVKTAQHNFPNIEEHGDVFAEDFTKYEDQIDWLIGRSPCTYWSIAQTKNRETVASGMGWELFSQYVRALHEAKPKYFLYENNKSMSKAIRESICEAFGFEPILINSALVSAQNRQRLYWVGIRQKDGTYRKANIEQPDDRGILLKDILDTAMALTDKAHACISSAGRTTEREYFVKHQIRAMNYDIEGVNDTDEGVVATLDMKGQHEQLRRVYGANGKAPTLVAHSGGNTEPKVFENTPECFRIKEATTKGYTDIEAGDCVDMGMPNSKTRRGRNMKDKSNFLQTSCSFYQYCGTVNTPIYKVKDGMITVK